MLNKSDQNSATFPGWEIDRDYQDFVKRNGRPPNGGYTGTEFCLWQTQVAQERRQKEHEEIIKEMQELYGVALDGLYYRKARRYDD